MLQDPLLQALIVFTVLLYALHLIESSGLLPTPKFCAQGGTLAIGMILAWRIANRLL